MLTAPPSHEPVDLLIVGGLTVDRFQDGASAAGGSVLHATRSLARTGAQVAVLTVAGHEPEALAGLAELQAIAASVDVTPSDHTITFRHREHGGRRRLWLEERGGSVAVPAGIAEREPPAAVLFAPVAGEVSDEILCMPQWPDRRGAILQGWLRTLSIREVEPLPLSALPAETAAALSSMGLLVASRQDLVLEGREPSTQLARVRERFGPDPIVVVTDGERGSWMTPNGSQNPVTGVPLHLPPPWVVHHKPTVGAGDIFAAHLIADRSQQPIGAAIERAMRRVAEDLDSRSSI